jgi:hypothetical protein
MIGTMTRCVCVIFVFAGAVSLAAGQEKNVVPGDTVFVMVSPDLASNETPSVSLRGDKDSTCPTDRPVAAYDVVRHGFTISILPDMCTGRYRISAQRASISTSTPAPAGNTAAGSAPAPGNTTPAPSDLVVTPQILNVQPVVTSIDPKAIYRDNATLTFLGPPSLKYDPDPKGIYHNYGIAFQDHALIQCADGQQDTKDCFKLCDDSQNGQIAFKIGDACLRSLLGKQAVYLVHNGAKSDAQTITIVPVSKNNPRNYALAVVAGLIVLVYLLISAGRRALQVGNRSFILSALFLDEETQTYSLSKCQFYAWTLAAILGYVFLAFSMSYVQRSAVFPDIPDGLPGIILASAGTAVLATGITSSRGSKGAGPVHPSLADFVTNGGVVAPERLQFVLWTVVGTTTFLTIVFNSDPLTVNGLPKIPSGFLQLMGISSAAYLGGKLARKPGPVIKTISVAKITEAPGPVDDQYFPENQPKPTPQYPVLTLHLQGENLDPKGSVKVDTQALRGDLFWIKGTPDPQTGFCSDLFVSLNNAAAYIKDSHMLTLVSSDSQSADVAFPVDPMKIESVSNPDANGNVIVTGKNFAAPTTYEWQDPKGNKVPLDPNNPGSPNPQANVQSSTSLTVGRPKAVSAGYTLVLISPVRLRAEKTI